MPGVRTQTHRGVVDLIPDSVFATIDRLDLPRSDHTFDVRDPATGTVLARVPDADEAAATAAVDAAAEAAAGWAATAPRVRSEALHEAFRLMIERREELAGLISAENGKALPDARAEVTYAAEFFRWFAEEAVRIDGDFVQAPAGGMRTIVTSRPVGVAALVTPWNFPAAMATRKIGPALAAGCTVVLKPAGETPLTAIAVGRILHEAGVPPGVVNVVTTSDSARIVSSWLDDPRVRKISFTGSTGVGRILLEHAAKRIVNPSMELGGNAPFVVAADADVEAAVAGAMIAKFRGGGQACTAANRFYVHADVVDEFVDAFGAAISELQVGSAFDPTLADDKTIGPVISDQAVKSLTALVDDAVRRGAHITHQGKPAHSDTGFFVTPTLLRDVPPDAEVVQTEAFGPVAPVVTWRDDAELLHAVNGTEFGLSAYVFSRDVRWAMQLAERIDSGMVGINRGIVSDPAAPFGGVKQSGLGREGGHEGLRAFLETQYLSIDWS
jgi:succinate-semialdehyde dehydrogenase/glutarate-semialdehyde dehydrogenase